MLIAHTIVAAIVAFAPWGPRVEWTDDGPEAREHASVLAFDDGVIVYAGSGYEPQLRPLGDAWRYDADSHEWTALTIEGEVPAPGGSKRVAAGPDGSWYLFGGYGAGFECSNDLHRVEVDGDSLVFTPMEQVNAPPARALHAFAFDPETERFFVGFGVTAQGFFDDAWVGTFNADGAIAWQELALDEAPEARFGFPFAFDNDTGELALFSGQLAPNEESQLRMADDLWSIDLRAETPAWIRHEVASPPAGRRNPCFAYDDAADRLLVWCGTADMRTNVPGLVWIHRDGDAWTITEGTDDEFPPRRSSGFGFADPRSDAIVVGFGNSAEGRYTDWVYIAPPEE